MRAPYLITLVVSLALATGCQQADGPVPDHDAEITNRIDDLTRDLLNVAGGNQQAPSEFLDDLMVFGDGGAGGGADALQALGRAVTPVLAGKTVSEESATQVATQLWLVVAGREMSERQGDMVLSDLRDALSGAGLSQEEIEPVVARAGEAQRASTLRPRKWYQRY